MYIRNSVGVNSVNNKGDVGFVQEILALLSEEDIRMPAIKADGICGPKTKEAIYKFQFHYVKLKSPDSRIDQNGRSEKMLVAKAIEIDKDLIPVIIKKHGLQRQSPTLSGSGTRVINYQPNAKRVLNVYTENVVKLAMGYSGILKCDISSTIRTFDDQARIMYDNCSKFPSATSVETLRAARGWGYAAPGREVEGIYFENKSKPRTEAIAAMKEKVASLYNQGKRVSLHCVSEADFKKNNILDIPYGSVVSEKRKDFERALMGMTDVVTNARYPQPQKAETYISRLIIEDRCWHLEIPHTNKPLPNDKKPAAPVVKHGKRPPLVVQTAPRGIGILGYFGAFLDDWF